MLMTAQANLKQDIHAKREQDRDPSILDTLRVRILFEQNTPADRHRPQTTRLNS
jgi:hypothetical protein